MTGMVDNSVRRVGGWGLSKTATLCMDSPAQREGFFRENRVGPASGLISRARGTRIPTAGRRCWAGLADPAAAAPAGAAGAGGLEGGALSARLPARSPPAAPSPSGLACSLRSSSSPEEISIPASNPVHPLPISPPLNCSRPLQLTLSSTERISHTSAIMFRNALRQSTRAASALSASGRVALVGGPSLRRSSPAFRSSRSPAALSIDPRLRSASVHLLALPEAGSASAVPLR